MSYLTDGRCLLEVVDERIVRNYGLGATLIRYTVVRDCLSGDVVTVTGDRLLNLRPIGE